MILEVSQLTSICSDKQEHLNLPQKWVDRKEHPQGPRSHPLVNSTDFSGTGTTSCDFYSLECADTSSTSSLSQLMCWVSDPDDRCFCFVMFCFSLLCFVLIIFPYLDIYSNYHRVWCSLWPWLSITNTELVKEGGKTGGCFFTVSYLQLSKLMKMRFAFLCFERLLNLIYQVALLGLITRVANQWQINLESMPL